MEFDESRVYTAINASVLKPGDKVIVADDLYCLKRCVKDGGPIYIIRMIGPEEYTFRFDVENNTATYALAYLVERADLLLPCPFCGGNAKKDVGQELDEYVATIYCKNCKAEVVYIDDNDDEKAMSGAIDKWNRRVVNEN